MRATRRLRLRSIVLAIALILSVVACTDEGADLTATTPVNERPPTTEQEATSTTAPPAPRSFRVGLIGNLTTDNWWASRDTMNLPQNEAYLSKMKTSLFELSLPGFALVPSMAATPAPASPTQDGDIWVVEQPIHGDRIWSDGVPVTTGDLAFYVDTVREFQLGGDHADVVPPGLLRVTAPDDRTVRLEFSAPPGLAPWHGSVALAPFVPSHYWQEHVQNARAAAAAATAGMTPEAAAGAIARAANDDDDPTNDIDEANVTPTQIEEYIAGVGARAGRDALYAVSGASEPSAGPLVLDVWERGAFAVTTANPTHAGIGAEKTLYSDGSFRVASPDRGIDEVFGGEGSGEVLAHKVEGSFVEEVLWIEHRTREAAYEALAAGEIDFVLDPSGVTPALRDELDAFGGVRFDTNLTEGFRYLAFNLRKAPMSDVVFRRATATVIDKESIADDVLAGAVAPGYTIVHPDLLQHYNDSVERPGWRDGEPLEMGARYESAIEMLREAGYTWTVEPAVNRGENGEFLGVEPKGEGLTMPNGALVPELTILAPGDDYDPFRATFSVNIASAMIDLGIPVAAVPTEFDSIVDAVFPPQTPESALQWDMYVMGWGAASPVLPGTSARAFFHSDQDAVLGGGFNTPGYASAEFDALADQFIGARSLEEAARLTKEMDAVLARDLPYVVLFRTRIVEAFSESTIFPVDEIMNGHQGYPAAWPGSVVVDE